MFFARLYLLLHVVVVVFDGDQANKKLVSGVIFSFLWELQ